MVNESAVLSHKLKHKGHWNFSQLYDFCYDWFGDNGYHLSEKKYTEKISAIGKNVKIEWAALKWITDYFQYKIEMRWEITGMKDVEVEEEGKKVSTNSGEVKITFTATLVKDYEKRWEDNPMWKFMRGVYDRYIIRTNVDEQSEKLEESANELISQVKAFLRLGR